MFPIRDINPTRIQPVVTWALIVLNAVIYFAVQPHDAAGSAEFVYEYAAIPCEVRTGDPLDLVEIDQGTCLSQPLGPPVFPDKSVPLSVLFSMFLHGDFFHLLFNMWSLWIFGNNVEEAFGRAGYLAFYLAAGVLATLGFVALQADSTVPLIGASGAIAGVMGAYLVLYPTHRILTLVGFFFVPIPAALFAGVWFFSQFLISASDSSIAWQAHVVGFAFGAVVALLLRAPLLRRVAAHQTVQWPGAI